MSNYRSNEQTLPTNIPPDNFQLVDIFKALANNHRLKIYNILTRCCTPGTQCDSNDVFSCCVGELDSQLDIAPSTLSHHLKELNRAGLIHMKRDGKQVFCSVNTDMMKTLQHLFTE
ncbi:MAG: helix-turn-helix transcriptional regulator [Gammaproteobacteria bacterium]|nr:helix-turn-helix transcriptional regulator [Gammaproteobacteria bacterium]